MNIGIFGLLFIIFLVLKLIGFIAWSWWWVFSPLIISTILFIVTVSLIGYFKSK